MNKEEYEKSYKEHKEKMKNLFIKLKCPKVKLSTEFFRYIIKMVDEKIYEKKYNRRDM